MIISGERQISYPDIQARIARAATGFKTLDLRDAAPVAMMLRNDFALFARLLISNANRRPRRDLRGVWLH